jgi:hypothetical protein
VACDSSPQLSATLDAQNYGINNIGASGNDIVAAGYHAVNGTAGAPSHSFVNQSNMGMYRPTCNNIGFTTSGTIRMRISNAGQIFQGCDETANACSTIGYTINQGTNDNEILSFKSYDVAHGVTGFTETDTFASFRKVTASGGGAKLTAITEAGQAFVVRAIATTVTACTGAAHTALGTGNIHFGSDLKSGTGRTGMSANGNLFAIASDCVAHFIVDGEGDLFANGSATTVYDSYCDAQLSRALSHTMEAASCTSIGVIQNKWDDFILYNEQTLIDLDILGGPVIGVDPREHGLVNVTQLQRLHNGAIWQLHSKLNDQAEELTALKGQLKALGGCS